MNCECVAVFGMFGMAMCVCACYELCLYIVHFRMLYVCVC